MQFLSASDYKETICFDFLAVATKENSPTMMNVSEKILIFVLSKR